MNDTQQKRDISNWIVVDLIEIQTSWPNLIQIKETCIENL